MKDQFYKHIENLQDSITSKIEEVDGLAKFEEDIWQRQEGGGGRTRVIENGAIFEKGGVNISAVHGELPEVLRKQFNADEGTFFACGLSLVLHPINPMIPTVHANWRYFEMYDTTGKMVTQWFGGGQDLTPYYLFDEDAIHFHTVCKNVCNSYSPDFYSTFKKNCDDYFWNAHREEARGVGGLFFDYLKATNSFTILDRYNFVTAVGASFLESYLPIVKKRKDISFTISQKDWQEIRRGRYVEFNLVHDRGTLFGLKTNGRIESILMSLPPVVQWKYNHHPEKESEEERLIAVLTNPKEWV
jgi:coproporphyrinogen III oxidase